MNEHKNVWVVVETTYDHECANVSLELLSPASRIAKGLGEDLYAVVIGCDNKLAIEQLKEYGVENIISVENEMYFGYNTEAFEYAVAELAKKYKPDTVFFGATDIGRDLAPRVAANLSAGLTADCTELDVDLETRNVLWSRPALGGNLMAVIIAPDTRPQMGTVRPGVFKKEKLERTKEVNLIEENVVVPKENIRTKILEKNFLDILEDIDIEGADILVSGGRGLGEAKNFDMLKELAELLGGSIACTSGVVDNGWLSRSYQVGQSGKNVNPKVYFAIGISGSIQHVCGMSGSEIIVAINNDPDAPIFEAADYGIVGDLFEVVPKLIEVIKSRKG